MIFLFLETILKNKIYCCVLIKIFYIFLAEITPIITLMADKIMITLSTHYSFKDGTEGFFILL